VNSLLILFIFLLLLIIAVSGKAGLKSIIGLISNFIVIIILLLLLALGLNAYLALLIFVPLILALTIFTSSDHREVTYLAFKSSLIIVGALFLLAVLVQYLGNLQGFTAENISELEGLSTSIGVNFANIMIVVMIVSLLGAVAEASMAFLSSLSEVMEQDRKMTLEHFQAQRQIISQQILGTAVNTLFFGMLGTSVALVLWLIKYHESLAQILNSKLLVADIATMLLGMIGILLIIWLSGHYLEKKFKNKNLKNRN